MGIPDSADSPSRPLTDAWPLTCGPRIRILHYPKIQFPVPPEASVLDHPLTASLNPPQREAVLHTEGPLLILAGPGSGKTRVVTHRIAHLLAQGVPDYQILALTFTNKAADEMRRRVAELVPGRQSLDEHVSSLLRRLLRQYATSVGLGENFTIYDTDDSEKSCRETVEELGVDLTHVTPERRASGHQLGQEPSDSARSLRAASRQRGRDDRQAGLSGLSGSAAGRLGGRFRRSAAARRHAAAPKAPSCAAASTPAIATSWSTNIRTRIWRNTRSSGRCRSIIRIWRSRAIRINRSTAGAARI